MSPLRPRFQCAKQYYGHNTGPTPERSFSQENSPFPASPDPWTGAPCSPKANVGRERRGVAPSNVFCRLSESIRRSSHIRPMLASGEHGAPVQGLGLAVRGEFTYTTTIQAVGPCGWIDEI